MPKLSLQEAKNNLVYTSVTIDGNWLPLSCSLERIGTVTGVGMQLYFTFLKYVGVAFFMWACFQLPLLLITAHGTGGASASGIARTTAYNLGIEGQLATPKRAISSDESWDIPGLGPLKVREMMTWMGVLDAAGLLCFIIIVGWFCYRVLPRIVKRFDEDNITPSDFSIEISGLPERVDDHEQYESKLTTHIATICQRARKEIGLPEAPDPALIVVENCLVRDYNGQLLKFQKLAELQRKLANANQKDLGPKKDAEIAKIEQKMQKLRASSKAPVMKVEARNVKKRSYVMLDTCENKEILLNYYRFGTIGLFRYFQKPHLRFEGRALKIVQAPEPGNIMWENQDRDEWLVFLRKCFTALLSIIIFSMSFAIIVASKTYTKKLQDALADCPAPKPGEVILTVDNWQNAPRPIDYCGCEQIGLGGVTGTPALKDGDCKDWVADTLLFNVLVVSGAFIVVVVNYLLQIAVVQFTKMEQPLSLSSYHASLAEKIFVAQFFNTAIIVLLVNAKFFASFFNLSGGYDDFEREWYSRVGVAIIITMVVQAFSPHIPQVAAFPVLKLVRHCMSRFCQTQQDLNALYTSPDFRLAVRLAGLLNVLFCSMMYSAGLPLLSITATVTFLFVFVCDKFLVLRASKMPPAYDQTILLVFNKLCPLACFAHSAFAIYMFGNPLLFPSDALVDALSPEKLLNDAGAGFSSIKIRYLRTFAERCVSGAGFANFLVCLLIVIFLALKLAKMILGTAFGSVVSAICAGCPCGKKNALGDSTKKIAENETTSRNSQMENVRRKSGMLFTYAIEEHPLYADLVMQARNVPVDGRITETDGADVADQSARTNINDLVVVSIDPVRETPDEAPGSGSGSDEDMAAQKYARATVPAKEHQETE